MCEKHHGPHGPRGHHGPRNDNSFLTGVLFGAAVGAVLGMLLAPKSGKETQQDLKEKSEDLVKRGKEKASQIREQVEPVVNEIREKSGPALEKGKVLVADLRTKMEDLKNNMENEMDFPESKPKKNFFKKSI
ncbi:hypothetical protein A2415_05165 [candidate division WWE3 bacterium RIFOXYC1_FULL_39_7]|uniref:Gas vesicle protein n=2 Tax=Katanobacteria TaxID=422282 RepID=A0A1F4X8C6_UNCKA|nr:MAG: hypothetical protein A2415_05165 [candidate division WWE3 bacterium RIFOXYC1_FULL_39_7]OGC77960.1 MAG: hypothetical protein A2619_00675 [candidate division WWE3 bacterium RIFOXYD1_FULL_39_9]